MSPRSQIDNYNETTCSICGKSGWTGSWRGEKLILICRDCATEILPVLIADATWRFGWSAASGASDLVKIERTFWRAQAINMEPKRNGNGGAHV